MISATDPLGKAFNHTTRVLFQPFDFRKWLVLGFAAFLATLGEGGGSFNVPDFSGGSGGSGGGGGGAFEQEAVEWIRDHFDLVIAIGVTAFVVLLAIGLVVGWLNARGKFIFLDNVAHNEAAIAAPWREYAREGNRLFVFNTLLGLGALLIVAAIGAGAVLLAWDDIRKETFGSGALLALGLASTLLPLFLALIIVNGAMQSFGIPLMYLRRIGAVAALRAAFAEVVFPHLGAVIVYSLLLMVLGLGAAVLAFVAILLTCCLGALPYLNSVLMLPITVFFRALPLYFMEQIGPKYRVIGSRSVEDMADVFR